MNSSSSSGRSSPISCPSTRVGDIVSMDRSTDDECMKSKRRNETRPLFNKILTMVGNKAPLIFVVTLLVTLWCGYREFSAIALRGAETYRALMEWNGLSSGVYRAFVGDQKVMEQQLASSFPDHAGWHGGDKNKLKKTRGILIPAGGKNQMLNAFVNLYVLRHRIGCRLPVTIAYWGDLEKVKNHTLFDRHMDSPSVSFLDLSTLAYPRHHRWLVPPNPDGSSFWNGFKIKVFALYASPYDQVVLMDSDAMAAQDPEGLFRHPDFVKKGNMFWPDRWCTRVKLFSMLGMGQQQQQYQTDSGQFLFDKTRHPDVLEWLLFLNTHDEFTYRYAHGDKDTYRAAFYMAGKEDQYVLVHQPLSVGLSYRGFFRSSMPQGFIQHHPDDGSIAFIHRTSQAKYSLGDEHGRTFTHMLLQPNCEWNRRYWHFFRPMVHSVPVLEKPKGKKQPAKEVVIVKIDPSSDIAAYQYTADEAAHLYRSEYSSRDDGQISRNETTWLVHITLEVVCVLCVLYLLSIGLRMVLRRFYCQDIS